jgi:hypothetical protein
VKPPALDGGSPIENNLFIEQVMFFLHKLQAPLESISEGDVLFGEEGRSSPSLLLRNGEPDLSESSKRRNALYEPIAPRDEMRIW